MLHSAKELTLGWLRRDGALLHLTTDQVSAPLSCSCSVID